MCEHILALFVLSAINEDLLYFSYPFIRDEKFKSDPFIHLSTDMILTNSIQRNGGVFRFLLNSVFILIEHKIKRERISEKEDLDQKDKWDVLLGIIELFLNGYNPWESDENNLINEIKQISNLKGTEISWFLDNDLFINPIFNIDPKFRVEGSWLAIMKQFNKW